MSQPTRSDLVPNVIVAVFYATMLVGVPLLAVLFPGPGWTTNPLLGLAVMGLYVLAMAKALVLQVRVIRATLAAPELAPELHEAMREADALTPSVPPSAPPFRGRVDLSHLAARAPYQRLASTPLEDQVGRPCACERCTTDGQHEPACAVHEEPPAACDCARRT